MASRPDLPGQPESVKNDIQLFYPFRLFKKISTEAAITMQFTPPAGRKTPRGNFLLPIISLLVPVGSYCFLKVAHSDNKIHPY